MRPVFVLSMLALLFFAYLGCDTEGQNLPSRGDDVVDSGGKDHAGRDDLTEDAEPQDDGPAFDNQLGWKVLNPGVNQTWNSLTGVTLPGGGYRLYAGGFGIVVRFDGKKWQTYDVEKSVVVSSIWAQSEEYLVVCGEEGLLKRRFDWKGNGNLDWYNDDEETGVNTDLKSVHAYDKDNIWAVGVNGTVLQYSEETWKKWEPEETGLIGSGTPPSYPDMLSVLVLGPHKAMIVGEGMLVTYDAGAFTIDDTTFADYELSVVYAASGTAWLGADKGTVFELKGGDTWEEHNPNVYSKFDSMWMSSAGKLYVAGPDIDGEIWSYDGNPEDNWEYLSVESPKFIQDKRAVNKVDPQNRVAPMSRISGIWGTGDENLFVCTKEKQIIHYAVHP